MSSFTGTKDVVGDGDDEIQEKISSIISAVGEGNEDYSLDFEKINMKENISVNDDDDDDKKSLPEDKEVIAEDLDNNNASCVSSDVINIVYTDQEKEFLCSRFVKVLT